MRHLIITRKKSFYGALIPYFCIVGIGKANVDETDFQYPISNGKTIDLEIENCQCCVVVGTNTSTGTSISKPYIISEGTEDVNLELVTKYSWVKGSTYELVAR